MRPGSRPSLTGFGASLAFPSFGIEAMKGVPPQNRGGAEGPGGTGEGRQFAQAAAMAGMRAVALPAKRSGSGAMVGAAATSAGR